jgi:AmiR/NasT family two-component response regulator
LDRSREGRIDVQNIRGSRLARKLLKDTQAALIHPPDADRSTIETQLRLAQIATTIHWPYPTSLPVNINLVIVYFDDAKDTPLDAALQDFSGVLVSIVCPDRVSALDHAVAVGSHGLLVRPVRSIAVAAQLYAAAALHAQQERLRHRIVTMEGNLRARRDIEKAVRAVAIAKGVTPDRAYELLRQQAMNSRCTVQELARSFNPETS